MSSQKKPSVSSTLWPIGECEYENHGISLDEDDNVFNASTNDLSTQNKNVRSSILRRTHFGRSISVGRLKFRELVIWNVSIDPYTKYFKLNFLKKLRNKFPAHIPDF